ncbi:tetratricopeptide repeat protein [Pseudomonas fluorescens]|uniref:tetratricopeptide repeat protein n=1 Tax=Pseudomonas fluorescens TaxID=294 RepID=UPI0012427994|nr:tetratricopeptide repeat protein [Pseudomonas fluorescens]VVO54730.1 hypothetical protein PS898_00474 [Pseudomonas fluorescens]
MYIRVLLFTILSISNIYAAQAELNVQDAHSKTQGIILYNQLKSESAIPFLQKASEAGDHEAQYFLAEALRKKNHYMNPEARKWYEASAKQGDLYAMIQLGRIDNDICDVAQDCPTSQKEPIEWLNQAKEIAQEKSEHGNAEAMYIMYEITLDESWLQKAALAGDPQAQYWIAIGYKQGEGFFLPWKRSQEVEKWFKLSSEKGNPKSMMEYAALLYEKGDIGGFRYWNEQAALVGNAESVYNFGSYLAHEPDTFGFPYDPVKGYSLVSSLQTLDGGGGMQVNVKYKLPIIAAKLTSSQIAEANELSKKWALTNPPLSFFPEKLSR